jgi:hypothetical protein
MPPVSFRGRHREKFVRPDRSLHLDQGLYRLLIALNPPFRLDQTSKFQSMIEFP